MKSIALLLSFFGMLVLSGCADPVIGTDAVDKDNAKITKDGLEDLKCMVPEELLMTDKAVKKIELVLKKTIRTVEYYSKENELLRTEEEVVVEPKGTLKLKFDELSFLNNTGVRTYSNYTTCNDTVEPTGVLSRMTKGTLRLDVSTAELEDYLLVKEGENFIEYAIYGPECTEAAYNAGNCSDEESLLEKVAATVNVVIEVREAPLRKEFLSEDN